MQRVPIQLDDKLRSVSAKCFSSPVENGEFEAFNVHFDEVYPAKLLACHPPIESVDVDRLRLLLDAGTPSGGHHLINWLPDRIYKGASLHPHKVCKLPVSARVA